MKGTLQGIWHCSTANSSTHNKRIATKSPTKNSYNIRVSIALRARFLLVKSIVSMKWLVEGTVQTECDVRKRTRICGTFQLVQASPTQVAKEQTVPCIRGFYLTIQAMVAGTA